MVSLLDSLALCNKASQRPSSVVCFVTIVGRLFRPAYRSPKRSVKFKLTRISSLT
jgi:hypothetical protein